MSAQEQKFLCPFKLSKDTNPTIISNQTPSLSSTRFCEGRNCSWYVVNTDLATKKEIYSGCVVASMHAHLTTMLNLKFQELRTIQQLQQAQQEQVPQ